MPRITKFLMDPREQLAQGRLMLARRIQGRTIDEIAQEFAVSIDTVSRRLKMAKKDGALEEAVERILGDLLAKSLSAYEGILNDPDVSPKVRLAAAKDIAFGTGVLSTNNKAQINPQDEGPKGSNTLSLRAWREKRFATKPSHTSRKRPTSIGVGASGETEGFEDVRVLEFTGELPAGIIEADFSPYGEDGVSPSTQPSDESEDGDGI